VSKCGRLSLRLQFRLRRWLYRVQPSGRIRAQAFELRRPNAAGGHAVGREGRSPLPAAPAFREFGRRWSIDQGALGERVSVTHGDMPEFIFEPDEIADLVAYLLSIQEK